LALGTWHLALGTWHLALGTWHLALGTWHQIVVSDERTFPAAPSVKRPRDETEVSISKKREACTYDTGSIWPCRPLVVSIGHPAVLRAMVCDPEQDYWRVSPDSPIWRKAFCKGAAFN
jgi:hypothetical protein